MAAVFRRSAATLCKTGETLQSIPPRFHDKCLVQVELGTDGGPAAPRPARGEEEGFRALYVGRLVYWKGLHLGLAAFARLLESRPGATLTVIGSGPDEAWLRDAAQRLGIGHAVNWIPRLEQAAVMRALRAPRRVAVSQPARFQRQCGSGGALIRVARGVSRCRRPRAPGRSVVRIQNPSGRAAAGGGRLGALARGPGG